MAPMILKNEPSPYGPLSRALDAERIAGVDLRPEPLRVALSIPAAVLRGAAFHIGPTVLLLPRVAFAPGERATYASRLLPEYDTLSRKVIAAGLALDGTRPEAVVLPELTRKTGAFVSLRLLGDRVKNAGLDLRLCLGAYQWFQIDRVVTHLETRFADPDLTRAEQESLLDTFGPMLRKLDEVLRKAPERREELFQRRQDAADAAEEAQRDADQAEVVMAVRAGLSPSRERLLQAARRHAAGTPGVGPEEVAQPAAVPADVAQPAAQPDRTARARGRSPRVRTPRTRR